MTMLNLVPSRTRNLDKVFNDILEFPVFRWENNQTLAPRVNIKEDDEQISMIFEVPGMEKDEIKINVKEGVLTLSGERKVELEDKKNGFVRAEFQSGSFKRSFTLPDTVNTEKIQADYKNGLLTVVLPKLEEVKPKEIDIQVK